MNEHELRALIEEVRSGEISRRSFVQRMVALGLTAPMASAMLMHSGVAQAQVASTYKPTKRGGGGALRVLWWQGATLLNPHFATGTKDQEGSRILRTARRHGTLKASSCRCSRPKFLPWPTAGCQRTASQ